MKVVKCSVTQVIVCLYLLMAACQTPSDAEQKSIANNADISEENANLVIDSTVEDSPGSQLNEGDEANFLNSNSSLENFANQDGNRNSENMFGDELENDIQPKSADSTVASGSVGDELGQESLAADPTALPPSDLQASDLALNEDLDPVASALAEQNKAVAPPAAAAASSNGDTGGDVVPVGEGSDQLAPQIADPTQLAASSSEAPSSAPAASVNTQTSPAEPQEELEPTTSVLTWVGYRIKEKERQLKVEISSQGQPDFEVFEEANRSQQMEIVIRFYQTSLRKKIRWDINSSEFRSPVAYIRMREFKEKGIVDVILTHRDAVMPQFFSRQGRILLSYTVPDRYFNSTTTAMKIVKDKAVSLIAGEDAPLKMTRAVSTQGPEHIGVARGRLFRDEPTALRPIKDVLRSHRENLLDKDGLPDDFERKPMPKEGRSAYRIERFSLSSVAQDDLDAGEAEEEESSNALNALRKGREKAAANDQGTNATNTEVENAGKNEQAAPVANESAVSNTPTVIPTEEVTTSEPLNSAPAAPPPDPVSEISITNEAMAEPAPVPAQQALPVSPPADSQPASPIEMTGQANPNAGQQYNGKPIFMEFYEAPLSLVLKSFSEETGNNFVYSSTIGSTPVTVHFKGVPWDEALKAILETYSLGMVRIGENVVRIDQVTRLTQYMQELEQAKQFEIRRIPTRVLVFRLNNAVAKDIATRLTALLARDVELDARTKIQADDRTNAIVMEASTQVLGKAKAIIERLDLETPQVEIASRIVEVQKTLNNFFGVAWGNSFNFDPGRALGFGSLNFPNSIGSSFAVDPGVQAAATTAGVGRFRFGSLNKFIDLDLLLRMEEKRGTTNVLQSNRVLVLDGQKASILAGNSKFFRPAAGAAGQIPGQAPAGGGGNAGGEAVGLAEVKFNLQLDVKPQITALGSVIMDLLIKSDTPGDPTGEALASKNTRELTTQMVRDSGDTGVIGGIYDTSRTTSMAGVPFLSDIPIIGALFRSNTTIESQTELLIMVTPTIVSGRSTNEADGQAKTSAIKGKAPVISIKNTGGPVRPMF